MDNIVWVATIAGIALGGIVILALFLSRKSNETLPVLSYKYNEQGKLVSIQPQSNQSAQPNFVKLVEA